MEPLKWVGLVQRSLSWLPDERWGGEWNFFFSNEVFGATRPTKGNAGVERWYNALKSQNAEVVHRNENSSPKKTLLKK